MRKYFLLIIVASNVLAGCQRVDENNSSTSNTNPSKLETPVESTTTTVKKDNETFKAEVDSSALAEATTTKKQTEQVKEDKPPSKKPVSKPKTTKKDTKPKKSKKKLSTDLVKNTKTAAPKNKKAKVPLPKLEFEYKTFNFGTVDEGDTVLHKFKFINNGDAPAIISEASTSCGCTVPSYPKKPIKPGEKGIIEVMFNTKGKLLEQKKSITLTANTEPMYNTLYLEGLVYRRPAKKEEDKEEEKKEEKKKGKAGKKKTGKAKKGAPQQKKNSAKNKTGKPKQNTKNTKENNLKIDSLKSKESVDLSKQKKKKP